MQTVRLILSVSIGFTAAACNANFPAAPSSAATVTALVIFYPNVGTRTSANTLSAQFEAYAIDSDGVYTDVTRQAQWSSSDQRFIRQSATPGSPSVFGFLASGNATIIARYQGMVATLPIDVRPGLTTTNALEIRNVGSNINLRRTVTRYTDRVARDVTASVTWSSSDERIATVDERGLLRLAVPGNVRITATLEDLSDYYWMSVPPRGR